MKIANGFRETSRIERQRSLHARQTDKWDCSEAPIRKSWISIVRDGVLIIALLALLFI